MLSTTSVQIGCGTRSLETTPIFGRTNRKPSRFASRRSRWSAAAPSSTDMSRPFGPLECRRVSIHEP